jgi:hypothetical protein
MHGQIELAPQGRGQDLRLVEAAFRLASARQRHPRDDVGPRRRTGRHGPGESAAHPPHPAVLEMVDRAARRTLERERRSGARDRPRRALEALVDGPVRRWGTAPIAPGRRQSPQGPAAPCAEGPFALAAARAPWREDDVERPSQHLADDTAGVGHGPCATAGRAPAAGRRPGRRRIGAIGSWPPGTSRLGLCRLPRRSPHRSAAR